jgi:hypothetical protein
LSDLVPVYIKKTPVCPAGGTYEIGSMETAPTCSLSADPHNHVLPGTK